jgi:4-aminobutyrate aminotransferase-like enzyme
MIGIEVVDRTTRAPLASVAAAIQRAAIGEGVILITSGPEGNVIRVLPPLVITDLELRHGLDVLERAAIAALAPATTRSAAGE